MRVTTRAKKMILDYCASGIRPGQQAVVSALIEWFISLEDATLQAVILDSVKQDDRSSVVRRVLHRMLELAGEPAEAPARMSQAELVELADLLAERAAIRVTDALDERERTKKRPKNA